MMFGKTKSEIKKTAKIKPPTTIKMPIGIFIIDIFVK